MKTHQIKASISKTYDHSGTSGYILAEIYFTCSRCGGPVHEEQDGAKDESHRQHRNNGLRSKVPIGSMERKLLIPNISSGSSYIC